MYLKDSKYSEIYLFLQNLDRELKDGIEYKAEYKTCDKDIADKVEFKCFDFNISKNFKSVFIEKLKYLGGLEFSYDKRYNKVLITKVPYIILNNNNIPIFTSDIACIIIKLLSKYTDTSNLEISFIDWLAIIAIDYKVCEVIPNISNTKNYQLLQKILNTIAREIMFIERDIKKHHDKIAADDAKKERIIMQKSKICGVSIKDYEDLEVYNQEINKRLCVSWQNRIMNLKRHLEATKKKYKEMLLGTNKIVTDDVDGFLEKQIEKDISSSADSILTILRKAKTDYRLAYCDTRNDGDLTALEYNIYLSQYRFYPFFMNYMKELSERNIKHLFFTLKEYDEESFKRNMQHTFQLAFDYLEQIDYLQKCIDYYNKLLKYPERAFLNFKKMSFNWNAVIQLPYWLKVERDTYNNVRLEKREMFGLLMIKPGVEKINYEEIRQFNNDKDKKRRFSLDSSYIFDRLMITIPSSLNYGEIKSLVEYGFKHGVFKNFICENSSVACMVKQVCIDIYLNEDLEQLLCELYFSSNCQLRGSKIFISVAPDYYRNYFIDTPDNKKYWHRFDYLSDYKFKRKNAMDFNAEIVEAIIALKEYNIPVNEKNIKELILGGYLGEDKFVELRERYYEGINDINNYVNDNSYDIKDYDLVSMVNKCMHFDGGNMEHLQNTKNFIARGYYSMGENFYFDGDSIYKDEVKWIETVRGNVRTVMGKSLVCKIRDK